MNKKTIVNEQDVLQKIADKKMKLLEASINASTNKIETVTFECPICGNHRTIKIQQLHQVEYCKTCTLKFREQRRHNNKNLKYTKKYQ